MQASVADSRLNRPTDPPGEKQGGINIVLLALLRPCGVDESSKTMSERKNRIQKCL